jgi:ATP-dependent exoDNAse (exonuclease V) alpha subunit
MYRQMTSGADLTSVVVGSAGSGKTTALDAVRYALGSHGIRMYGVSTSAIATQGLKDAARIEGNTVAGLLLRIEFEADPDHPARLRVAELQATGKPPDARRASSIAASFALPSIDHLVIDEASMLAVTDQARIMEWAQARGIAITLVGDHKQLKAVGPTSLLGSLISARGAARLSENLRQRTDVGRRCATFLRDGRPHDALQILAAADQFLVARSEVEKNRLLVESWLRDAGSLATAGERMRQTGLDSDRNDQVDILNGLARHWARQRGWLEGDDVTFRHAGSDRSYAVGDHVQVTKNIKRGGTQRSLSNGTRAIVTSIDQNSLHISYWDDSGQHVDRLTSEQAVTHAKHGYATTTHKLQGQTLKSLSIDLGGDRDLSSAYVAFTRSQDSCVAVVNVHDIAEGAELEALLRLDREALTDAVAHRVADRMTTAGFGDQLTAHEVVGRPLKSPTVTPHDSGGIR